MSGGSARFMYAPGYLNYDFGADHPMRPERGRALVELLDELGYLQGDDIMVVEPPPATDDELMLAHARSYIDTVRALSNGTPDRARADAAGLGEGDTPAFRGMHDAAALITGGTLAAVRAVMRGETIHAFNPGGGLHHAHRDRASGFCVYNDLAVGIAAAVQEHEAKVLYLDFDVHHGDGVQTAFYDDPRVLTVSFHETGKYLFPGTGTVLELGNGAGTGYSVNVPLAPFTQDDSWLAAIEAVAPPLAEQFTPDLIVSQFGCDGHAWDGQAHVRLTTRAYAEAVRLTHQLAHRHCGGRWVATGGGGYDPVRVVPRVWALVWAEMVGRPAPERLPDRWVERWEPFATAAPMPRTFIDDPTIVADIPRRAAIEGENAETVTRVRALALSPQLRQAYRPSGPIHASTLPWTAPGRIHRFSSTHGELLLRDRCPASLVRRMRVEEGMHAFSRSPEREALLFRTIAARPENNLVVAHTPSGTIVAELTLAPADGRWSGVDGLYEAAIEVAPDWRGEGLAEALLGFAFDSPAVERLIVLAVGVMWHWDLETAKIDAWTYRERLVHLFATAGFEVYPTDDPEVAAGEANVLLARVGREAPHELYEAFFRRLQRQGTWLGI